MHRHIYMAHAKRCVLLEQHSRRPCTRHTSFDCDSDQLWVTHGCRGRFLCGDEDVRCGTPGGGGPSERLASVNINFTCSCASRGRWSWTVSRKVVRRPSEPHSNGSALRAALSGRCAHVANACFEAEQIILHGADATADASRLEAVLARAHSPTDEFRLLHHSARPTVVLAASAREGYHYLPLAVGKSARSHEDAPRWWHRSAAAEPEFTQTAQPALAYFTTWTANVGEQFDKVRLSLLSRPGKSRTVGACACRG